MVRRYEILDSTGRVLMVAHEQQYACMQAHLHVDDDDAYLVRVVRVPCDEYGDEVCHGHGSFTSDGGHQGVVSETLYEAGNWFGREYEPAEQVDREATLDGWF